VTVGRLVFPALRWRDATGFAHETGTIEQALGRGVGGFILFGGRFDQVRELTARLHAEAGRQLLIAADLERGPGQQVQGLPELPPPLALASLEQPALVRGAGLLTGVHALRAGINWVLAPVADLDLQPENPIVQTRSFGGDPSRVAALVAAWIEGCQGGGAMACAKHFPGHGRTTSDSHDALPSVATDAATLSQADLVPFEAAVRAGVGSVMTAHVAFPALDPAGAPATRSAAILDLLRQRMGFAGLVVSDALMMEGALGALTEGQAAVAAIEAGVDALLYPADPWGAIEALRQAERGAAFRRRVNAALERHERALAGLANPIGSGLEETGSSPAVADWLLGWGLVRGAEPRFRAPLDLVLIDDDLGERYPPSSSAGLLAESLLAGGVTLGPGGSTVAVVLCEPRASKGRAGLSERNAAALGAAARVADLVLVFGHPRIAAGIPGSAPVLLAWHRQRLMQEAAARWLRGRLG